jgi:hypothetical protein
MVTTGMYGGKTETNVLTHQLEVIEMVHDGGNGSAVVKAMPSLCVLLSLASVIYN